MELSGTVGIGRLFCTWNAAAPTKEQLGAKYKQIATFEIQPRIAAFSRFSKDGNVCQMTIEKLGSVDAQHSDFDSTLLSGKVDKSG